MFLIIPARVTSIASRFQDGKSGLAGARRLVLEEAKEVEGRIDAIAAAFNEACGQERRTALAELRRELRNERRSRRRLARLERPLSAIACRLGRLLATSRSELARGDARNGGAPRAPAATSDDR